ncbi:TlpA disulfide reductase family protein [uncultured Bacteroides sp.]|uniref:TlpA disulfide reductase family protein n=1 Tax=uncultured Bacteroides sp. TaxID=162156 RepID=UPI002AA8E522|nr:TlpA disulfide reductase family protein [uncultured Bacteroides sp.]
MKLFIIPILIVLCAALPLNIEAQQTVKAGGLAIPIYNYTQLEPLLHPSADNDTTYVFNFWATYCMPCIKELPYFDQIAKEYASEKVKVVLISMDFKSKIASQVIPFIKKRNVQSPVVVLSDPDANSWIDKVSPVWSGALPATLIIKGKAREFYEKSFTYDELQVLTTKFLKQ